MPAAEAINANVFSPCGSYLVCGTALGRLHIWRFPATAAAGDGLAPPARLATLDAHGCAVYALTFAETASGLLLLSGADEEICGWRWADLLKSRGGAAPKAVLRLENPRTALRRGAVGQLSETSALAVDAMSGTLYSAAGDGNAYAWDLASQACVSTFDGVGEPLHCLSLCARRKQLVTGGEDGAVRLWDVRSASVSSLLRPDAPPQAGGAAAAVGASAGKGAGGWCGCMAVDHGEQWLVAGWGEGFLCTIELNTLGTVACMPTAAPPLACVFQPDSDFDLVSVGAECGVYSWKMTGELETRATCSSPSALALATGALPGSGEKIVAVGGSEGTVDVFVDSSHRAFTLRAQD